MELKLKKFLPGKWENLEGSGEEKVQPIRYIPLPHRLTTPPPCIPLQVQPINYTPLPHPLATPPHHPPLTTPPYYIPLQVQAINAVPSEAVEGAAAGGASSGPKSVYSGSSRNWDAIDSDLKQKEEEEKPEGEEVS